LLIIKKNAKKFNSVTYTHYIRKSNYEDY